MSTELALSPPAASLRWEGAAYGLAIRSEEEIDGLTVAGAAAGDRAVEVHVVPRAAIDATCSQGSLRSLGSQDSGAAQVAYFEHDGSGLLLRTASFGDYLIADGGRRVLAAPGSAAPEFWHRYVSGQVLPLAASMQGLEVLHAAAVSLAGRGIALAGASGAGKSSIATRLLASGARFVADDVVALESRPEGLFALPGPAVIRLGEDQERLLADGGRHLLGPLLARQDKALYAVERMEDPLPLHALYVLQRDPAGSGVQIAPVEDVRLLLASTYDGVTHGQARATRLLDVAQRLLVLGAAYAVRSGSDSGAEDVAHAIREHAEGGPS